MKHRLYIYIYIYVVYGTTSTVDVYGHREGVTYRCRETRGEADVLADLTDLRKDDLSLSAGPWRLECCMISSLRLIHSTTLQQTESSGVTHAPADQITVTSGELLLPALVVEHRL